VEESLWNNDWILGTQDSYKALKAVSKRLSFSLVELLLEKSCHKADFKRWIVHKWKVRPEQ
jgi:hypothetical protein